MPRARRSKRPRNPEIGPRAVGTTEIAVDAVTGEQIARGTISSANLGPDSVGSASISTNAVSTSEIVSDSVGASELNGLTTATSAGVSVSAGTPQNVSVTCPGITQVIGGGYAWRDDEANSIIVNAPSDTDPNHSWDVRGMVAAGSNTLFAWANCLAV
jgi:hypothetical protein